MARPGSRKVGVVGAGYVGLTTAACLAHLDHRVTCVDVDLAKVEQLRRAEVGIAEPGLAELVGTGLRTGRLDFTSALASLADTEIVFLCLPTPPGELGAADLSTVEAVLAQLRTILAEASIVVTKSTVPVGTARRASGLLCRPDVPIVSNPEFLREGHAVHDFLHPDRIVLGSADQEAARRVEALYQALDAPIMATGTESAELAKYASNAFLALKLSYVNELAELSERVGADIEDVVRVLGRDPRIGPSFLAPGPGWGGSCLPKDTDALLCIAGSVGLELGLLREAVIANAAQPDRVLGKVREATGGQLAGARIGLLGLAFKADTGDLRHSPALAVARRLAAEGAALTGYDPYVPAPGPVTVGAVHVVDDPYLVAKEAAVVVVLTESAEFRRLDWTQLAAIAARATVVDARNLLDPDVLADAGLRHIRMGRV